MVMETCTAALTFELLSVACTLQVVVPEPVGVPVRAPVEVFSEIPVGGEPEELAQVQQVIPGSDAVKVKPTYATLVVPAGRTQGCVHPAGGLLITGTALTVMLTEPVTPPMVQLAIAVPAATPVTTLPEMVKMAVLEDWNGQSLRKMFGAGLFNCAVSTEVPPTAIVEGVATTVMLVAGVITGVTTICWAESGAHKSARARRMRFMGVWVKREEVVF
jgi:hypothetical protein